MTQKEKINELKDTIQFLYEKEGRSKNYISKLLNIDRKTLTYQMKEWGFEKANIKKLTPSNQKFVNKNKKLIKSRFDNDVPEAKIALELGVSKDYLRYIISKVDVLQKAKDDYLERKRQKTLTKIENLTTKSRFNYDFDDIDGEEWKEILGYEGYYISNMGRVKKYIKTYDKYILLSLQKNNKNGRMYIKIKDKGLQISRLVGFSFVDGYSETNNTIEHKDGDKTNNRYDNLIWVSQSKNNKLAYVSGRKKNIAYSKRGKFKKIILDNKYEFKTIEALAKFLGVSWTQANRYLDGECKFNRKLEIIY